MESIKELREICQKQKTTDKNFASAYGYLFHRWISIYITNFFLVVFPAIKPNYISALMVVISLAGVAMLAILAEASWQILGIILVYFGFLLDKVDGEIARYKNLFPLRGIYLDEIYHAVIPSAFIFGFLRSQATESVLSAYVLVLVVYFILLNRYGRKIWLILYAKNTDKIKNNEIQAYTGNNFVNHFFNLFPFKILSVLERFDVVILSVLGVLLAEEFYGVLNLRFYYLHIFLLMNVVYFIRWLFLNYFGGVDKAVKDIAENGY